ncbi:MAG: class I SAM-dependent methyltransferase [Acidithiobacillus sp.]
MDQQHLVTDQFGPTARNYLASPTHAQGADLKRLTALVRERQPARVLDLGCGAGHVSYALAPHVQAVTAYDLSVPMLTVVAEEARRRALPTIEVVEGSAENLPFADGTFDWIVTRLSAHHWTDIAQALKESRRVLKADGVFIVIDVVAPESPLLDTVLQSVELLRDASHVRDYRLSEWSALLNAAGFIIDESHGWKLEMSFASWIARMRTPELRAQAIRSIFAGAAAEVKAYFAVREDDSFQLDVAWITARPHHPR